MVSEEKFKIPESDGVRRLNIPAVTKGYNKEFTDL
jgi:hypothetical protein